MPPLHIIGYRFLSFIGRNRNAIWAIIMLRYPVTQKQIQRSPMVLLFHPHVTQNITQIQGVLSYFQLPLKQGLVYLKFP